MYRKTATISRRTLSQFQCLMIRRSASFMQFKNVVRRILKLQNCERVRRVLAIFKSPFRLVAAKGSKQSSDFLKGLNQKGQFPVQVAISTLPSEIDMASLLGLGRSSSFAVTSIQQLSPRQCEAETEGSRGRGTILCSAEEKAHLGCNLNCLSPPPGLSMFQLSPGTQRKTASSPSRLLVYGWMLV